MIRGLTHADEASTRNVVIEDEKQSQQVEDGDDLMSMHVTMDTIHQLGALDRDAMERAGGQKDDSGTNAEEMG